MTTCIAESIYKDYKVGDSIKVNHSEFGVIEFIVIDRGKDIPGSVTLLTKDVIKLLPFDAVEKDNEDMLECRQKYGNNRYLHANINKWLNSAAKGNWYRKAHDNGHKPDKDSILNGINTYDKLPGFLHGFDKEFLDTIVPVDKITVLPVGGGDVSNVYKENDPPEEYMEYEEARLSEVDYEELAKDTDVDIAVLEYLDTHDCPTKHPNNYDVVKCKMFLLSRSEVGLGNENGINEGLPYEWFRRRRLDDMVEHSEKFVERKRKSKLSRGCITNSDCGEGISPDNRNLWSWWLRTPSELTGHEARTITPDGKLGHARCYNGRIGLRVACVVR